jgi:TolB-like protein
MSLPKKTSNPGAFETLSDTLSSFYWIGFSPTTFVLDFVSPEGGEIEPGPAYAEALSVELVKRGKWNVLDRGIYLKVLKANQLNKTSNQDLESLKEIAKLLEIRYLVVGTVYGGSRNSVRISCKIIDTDSGKIFRAEDGILNMN